MSDQPIEVPVCPGCFLPVPPAEDYCRGCGATVGQYTAYVPFVNIRWEASGYDRLRRATLPGGDGAPARVMRVLLTLMLAPFLLFGLPFKWLAERQRRKANASRIDTGN